MSSRIVHLPFVGRPRFAIVCSRYNAEYVDGMLEEAQKALHGYEVIVMRVPGAFEIPLQVQRLAKTRRFTAIIALGLIWQGETKHAEEILRTVTDSLMRISLAHDMPVVHEVLSVQNETQAKERCLGKKLNRGKEAGQTALALAHLKAS